MGELSSAFTIAISKLSDERMWILESRLTPDMYTYGKKGSQYEKMIEYYELRVEEIDSQISNLLYGAINKTNNIESC